MGTRTNSYKNPSYAYNKQFNLNSVLQNLKSYNVATGNVPINEPATVVQRKRLRESRPLPDRWNGVKEIDGSMSHQEYIEKQRMEADSSQPYHELTADVLESSSLALNLVGYECDESTAAECDDRGPPRNLEEQLNSSSGVQYFPISASIEEDRIKTRSEQRYPAPGEPVCVVCRKYGQYICNETDDDICSIECKADLLQRTKCQQEPQSGQLLVGPLSARKCTLEVPESSGDIWDYDRHRWSKKISGLCTYECWKCQKPGHLAEDCLVSAPHCELSPAGEAYKNVPPNWKKLLDCKVAGHLSEHVRDHPTHQQYYSFKLKRLVKCCKPACKLTCIKDLLVCHYCFDKAFEKFYDMCTATWKPSGLSIIWNSICCEDHFEWHRMNCFSADVEDNAYILRSKEGRNEKCVQLSDFIF